MTHKDESYLAKLENQIEEWRGKVDALALKAERLTADARRSYDKALEERKAKLAAARQRLDALRAIGSDKWEEGKATVESFWKEAKAVFEKPVP